MSIPPSLFLITHLEILTPFPLATIPYDPENEMNCQKIQQYFGK